MLKEVAMLQGVEMSKRVFFIGEFVSRILDERICFSFFFLFCIWVVFLSLCCSCMYWFGCAAANLGKTVINKGFIFV